MKKILGKWNSRWSVLLLLLFFGPLANAPFAIANDIRFVPQVSLTNIAPISVACHPGDDNIVMVRNDNGRIDILDITDWSNPFKKLEIQGGIRAVAFSPDGKRIVSGGFDGKVRFWDAEFGTPVGQPLEGHKGVVSSVAFSPDGKRIASGDEDGVVRLWDTETGQPVGEPAMSHRDWVSGVAFSPDGKRIASGGGDGVVRLWDAETGRSMGDPLMGHENWVSPTLSGVSCSVPNLWSP